MRRCLYINPRVTQSNQTRPYYPILPSLPNHHPHQALACFHVVHRFISLHHPLPIPNMELCFSTNFASNLLFCNQSSPSRSHFAQSHSRTVVLPRTTCFSEPLIKQARSYHQGLSYHVVACLSATSEATTFEQAISEKTTPEAAVTEECNPEATTAEESVAKSTATDEITAEAAFVEETTAEECKTDGTSDDIIQPIMVSQDSSLGNDSIQLLKILEDLNIKFDEEEKYTYLALAIGASIALWIVASVVRAVDSIPLLPKVFELIGLGYTLWFGTVNLVSQERRNELVQGIEQFKQDVIG